MTPLLVPTPADKTVPRHGPGPGCMCRGFTLVELVLSLSIMSMLMLGMSGAIIMASRALPRSTAKTASTAEVAAALNQLNAELAVATVITELTRTAIKFEVADRGHGTAGPETIRWAWSGTAGAPLTRAYNGAVSKVIVQNVSAFALNSNIVAGTLTSAPRVLMIVNNPASLSTDEAARSAKIAAWGFPLTLVGSWDSQTIFDSKMAACDVVYVTDESISPTLFVRLNNPAVGIVTEDMALYAAVGVSTFAQTRDDEKFRIVDPTHEIVTGCVLNQHIDVCIDSNLTPSQHYPGGTLAAGARVLATTNTSGDPALIVIDVDDALYDNAAARSRRVALPWGGQLFNFFNFTDLAADPRTILRRSLVWAAAPSVYGSVSVNLVAGTASAAGIRIELVARPKVPKP